MENNFFEIKNLSFSYYKQPFCLRNINLSFNDKEKVLLLASKDMGKTTFLSVISSFESSYFGEIFLNGKELKIINDNEKKFSFLPSNPVFIEKKSIKYNFDYFCKNNNLEIISNDDLNKIFNDNGLSLGLNEKVSKLSLTIKKQLAVTRSLLKNPNIIFLDDQFEISNEREQFISNEISNLYFNLIKENRTIFFAISENTLKNNDKLLSTLNFDRVLYLCDASIYEFKNIEEFKTKIININQTLFLNDYSNKKYFKGNIFKENNIYYLNIKDKLFTINEKFYQKLNTLNLQNGEEEEIVIYFKDDFDETNLENDFDNDKLLIFSDIDGERLI